MQIPANIMTGLGRGLLMTKKYSPTILTAVGVVGMVGTTILASRATLKLEPIVAELNDQKILIKDVQKHLQSEELVTDQKQRKEITKAYVKSTKALVVLYGPTITLGLASISCVVAAHGIMHKRNVALVAAYKVVEDAFMKYRHRVIEEFGEDKDQEYRRGVYTEVSVDKETGKKTKQKAMDPNGHSQYAKFFDEGNENWQREKSYNLFFLRSQQNFANDLLHSRGHMFLNDIHDMLGMERTSAGAVVGWAITKDGDNFVDFGVYDFESEMARAFVNGDERSILLDFNVNGVIYDLI